jgi:hypothetical protein
MLHARNKLLHSIYLGLVGGAVNLHCGELGGTVEPVRLKAVDAQYADG